MLDRLACFNRPGLLPAVIFLLFPFLLSAQLNLQPLGRLRFDTVTLSGCWHHVDEEGTEYALVGTSKGLSIVDVSDPAHPHQRFFVPGPANNWREVRTWNGFAYVGSEAPNSGITIVDLRELPEKINWKIWKGDNAYPNQVLSCHSVGCTDGFLYLYGAKTLAKGVIICDLADPWNPRVTGTYDAAYAHDGQVRGNTLWLTEINNGCVTALDITDKSHPVPMAKRSTPNEFTHGADLSQSGLTLFTTDETSNAFLSAFNVSDLKQIDLLDTYQPSQNPSREVRNVRVLGDHLICPSYGGQLTIVDASRPDNLVEVGWTLLGNSVVWDADPYLPSGLVLATAKNEGLFIYKPHYAPAAFLEGKAIDAGTEQPLGNVTVNIVGGPKVEVGQTDGQYKTGVAQTGNYVVTFEKNGFYPQTFPMQALTSGKVSTLDVALYPAPALAARKAMSAYAAEDILKLSPMPFRDQLTVELAADSRFLQPGSVVRLATLSGQVILEEPVAGPSTPLQNGLAPLPAGQYILVLRQGQTFSRPMLVVKGQ